MSKLKNKGFTLIELLVVIAIIGILSSVVLASLNSARAKGNDAKTKATLSGFRAATEIFYDTHGQSYNNGVVNVCTADEAPVNAYNSNGTASYPGSVAIACFSANGSYVASHILSDSTFWCVDSLGNSKGRATAVAAVGDCNQ